MNHKMESVEQRKDWGEMGHSLFCLVSVAFVLKYLYYNTETANG